MATLTLFQIAQDTGWGSAETAARLSIDSDRWPALIDYLYQNHICFVFEDLPRSAELFGARDNDIHSRLSTVSALISDQPIDDICAGYNED